MSKFAFFCFSFQPLPSVIFGVVNHIYSPNGFLSINLELLQKKPKFQKSGRWLLSNFEFSFLVRDRSIFK